MPNSDLCTAHMYIKITIDVNSANKYNSGAQYYFVVSYVPKFWWSKITYLLKSGHTLQIQWSPVPD